MRLVPRAVFFYALSQQGVNARLLRTFSATSKPDEGPNLDQRNPLNHLYNMVKHKLFEGFDLSAAQVLFLLIANIVYVAHVTYIAYAKIYWERLYPFRCSVV